MKGGENPARIWRLFFREFELMCEIYMYNDKECCRILSWIGGGNVDLWIFWLVLGLIMVMVELFTGTLYFLWFGLGAMATAVISSIFPDNIWLQLIVAAAIVLILCLATPKFAKKFAHKSPGYKEDKYDLAGKKGIVVAPIHPNASGVVKIVGHGEWTAVSEESETIAEGTDVVVKAVNGLTVTVVPVKEED